jgi:hypothetical protein
MNNSPNNHNCTRVTALESTTVGAASLLSMARVPLSTTPSAPVALLPSQITWTTLSTILRESLDLIHDIDDGQECAEQLGEEGGCVRLSIWHDKAKQ